VTLPDLFASAQQDERARAGVAAATSAGSPAAFMGRETLAGGYGGVTYTHPSIVAIKKPGAIHMTIKDFAWIGKPFKSPIYYGVRVQRWSPVSGFGSMIDFTHAKAIAVDGDVATFSGTRDGRPVAPKARVDEVFRHLEFSHGHNLLTYNGMYRWPFMLAKVRPYIGIGAGITLPHTEIGFIDKNTRTYEYQFAGFVGQVLGGIEINLGRSSLFFEYKFSYAPYEVPLSEEPKGHLLFTDVWRQFRSWLSGEPPPGGRLSTNLATHHAIGGVMVRVGPAAASVR
jgi:lipid A oxidase